MFTNYKDPSTSSKGESKDSSSEASEEEISFSESSGSDSDVVVGSAIYCQDMTTIALSTPGLRNPMDLAQWDNLSLRNPTGNQRNPPKGQQQIAAHCP